MKKFSLIFYLSILTTTVFSQESNHDQIVNSFNSYKEAILNNNGEEAIKYVDSRTIKYYSDILETTKKADSAAVAGLGVLDKLMVLSIRHRTNQADILSFDGKALLLYAIKEGMVGKNSVVSNTIGETTINENFAKAEFIYDGQKTPFFFHFYKENEVWKMDLTQLFTMSRAAFKKMISDSGKDENIFFLEILEILTGKKPTSKIWLPIVQ